MAANKQNPDRKQRLSQALRDNLRKRKQQKRDKNLEKTELQQTQHPTDKDK